MESSEAGSIKRLSRGSGAEINKLGSKALHRSNKASDRAEAVDDLNREAEKDQDQVKRRDNEERHSCDRPYSCRHLIDELSVKLSLKRVGRSSSGPAGRHSEARKAPRTFDSRIAAAAMEMIPGSLPWPIPSTIAATKIVNTTAAAGQLASRTPTPPRKKIRNEVTPRMRESGDPTNTTLINCRRPTTRQIQKPCWPR
jgi:hypothetical protein